MPFALSDEQELIRKTARDVAEQVLAQHAETSDRSGAFPPEAGRALAELGLLGLLAAPEHGGAGLDAVSFVVMLEELARRSGGIACAVMAQNLAARALAHAPGHARWVPKLAAGQAWGSLALADGPLAAQLRGEEALEGSARPLPLADLAQVLVVPHPRGGWAAVEQVRWVREGALGLRGAQLGSAVLQGAPAERFDHDLAPLRSLGLAALAIGLGQASVEEGVRFAKDRIQFGKPIASFDGVRARLADMDSAVAAARALTWQAAARLDASEPAERACAEAKLVATEAASTATRLGVKLHGGSGFLKDFAAERLNRDARMLPLLGGDSAAQRGVAARTLLN